MSFMILGRRLGIGAKDVCGVGISAPSKGRVLISLRVARPVADELGVKAHDRVAIAVGRMADAGIVTLTPGEVGYRIQGDTRTEGLHLNASLSRLGVDGAIKTVRTEDCPAQRIEGGVLYLTLPGPVIRALAPYLGTARAERG